MNNVNWRTEYSDIIFWTAISALLLAIKLGAFYIDPTPRILLGDSGVYLSTALDHRSMPYERSFTYGYLIDFFAAHITRLGASY